MKLMVIDGQGGGIGSAIINAIRRSIGSRLYILATGTNSIATAQMMKAGANKGGTGENAIVQTSRHVDLIIGPISILMANSMLGELTPKMAEAISSSPAKKIILPLTQEEITILGIKDEPLPHLVAEGVQVIESLLNMADK